MEAKRVSFAVNDPGSAVARAAAAASMTATARARGLATKVKSANSDEELKRASAEMETVFLRMLFKEMQKTVPESSLFPREFGEGVYRDMLYDSYAEALSARGGIGLATLLYEQLSRGLHASPRPAAGRNEADDGVDQAESAGSAPEHHRVNR